MDESEADIYSKNIYLEDNLLKDAIQKLNLQVARKSWDDTNFDWSTTRFVIFRTTWDYFDRFKEFSSWLNKVSQQTMLLNSENLIRWNIDKHYLLDLKHKGIHICESYFIEKGDTVTLYNLSKKHSLDTFVIKPCILFIDKFSLSLSSDSKNKNKISSFFTSSTSLYIFSFSSSSIFLALDFFVGFLGCLVHI